MRYIFRYRRRWFWKSFEVTGHNYDKVQNKMVLFFKDGGLREIKNWTGCEIKLGYDWYVETRKEMEKKAGQKIPTDPE